jgi:glycine hydroxymethyltransferase
MIAQVLSGLAKNGSENNQIIEQEIKSQVEILCKKFPIY